MLELTAFLCGAFVMVLEMVGGRVLAPHVGTSAIVWTSIIGIVLAALAVGSFAGGRFADRHLSRKGLGLALAGAALGCAITAYFHTGICSAITSSVGNLYAAAVLAAAGIFAIPAFFFGVISPYIVRLRLGGLDNAGATVGRLYALSTAGSILGTFLGGFVLISWFSSTTILWALAVAMLLLSLANAPRKPLGRAALLLIFCGLSLLPVDNGAAKTIESPYNTLRLMEGTDGTHGLVRLMATDPGYSQSGMILNDPEELYFNYTRFYALAPAHIPDARSVLMLGGGGYSVPKWLLSSKSPLPEDVQVTVVELDPAMTRAAREYFALPDDPRLEIRHEDARAFLNRQDKKFDLIFMDVFNSHYSIPFQMGTDEAIGELRRATAPGGAVAINLISAIEGEDGRLFRSIFANLAKHFADVQVYCVGRPGEPEKVQNLVVLAFPDADHLATPQLTGTGLSPDNQEISRMQRHLYRQSIPDDVEPLTDEYAPVERYALMLLKD